MNRYMGQIMAECDCQHPACAMRGYCMASRIEGLEAERDHWKDVAGREGVCMSCSGPDGAPEQYGCTDCLNTGYCGEHHNTVAALGAKLAKAVETISLCRKMQAQFAHTEDPLIVLLDTTIAELKGQNQ